MSKRPTALTAIAAGLILGVGQSAVAQDPPIADHHERPVAGRHDQAPSQLKGEAL